MLKMQNEELSAKLRRAEIFLSRVKPCVDRLRASAGAKPCLDFDQEQRVMIKLKVRFQINMLYSSLNIMHVQIFE